MLEKFKIMISREMKNDDDYKKFSAKDKEFYDRMNKIIADGMINSLDKSVKYIPKSISFTGKNIAKVEITEISPDFENENNDSDENFNNALEKAGVTDEEMENLEHISDLSDQKKLFKLLKPEIYGIKLTDEFMMYPEASVSAIVFSQPFCKYFNM